MKKCFLYSSACALLVITAACTKSSPARPTETSAATGGEAVTSATVNGITLTTPQLATPTAGQRFKFADQPLTLTVKNAVSSGSTALTYSFQVASDANFASIVFSKDGVAEGAGQTSVTVDKLAGQKDYFWRARANSGSSAGPLSAARTFNVGPEVVLQNPVLESPANNSTATGAAILVATNIQRTGPAGPITYKFDLADSSSFGNIIYTTTVSEGSSGRTSVTVTSKVKTNSTYFWRVQASDASNGLTTAFSSTFSFKYIAFEIQNATFWDNPGDFKFWEETAKITSVEFYDEYFLVDFDKRDGPDRWPDVGFGSGALEYTLGLCVNIHGEWNCSATVQFWHGRELTASGRPDEIGINWWYDARWGALLGYQPACGELVGVYVGAGNLRDSGNVIAKERSDIVMMPFCGSYHR